MRCNRKVKLNLRVLTLAFVLKMAHAQMNVVVPRVKQTKAFMLCPELSKQKPLCDFW